MRKMLGVAVVVLAFGLAACGGGGGGSSGTDAAKTALTNAYDDFGTMIEGGTLDSCLDGTQTSCDCPGGGEMTANLAQRTITLTNCKSASGETYSGVFTVSADGTTMSATLTTFGDCTNGTATDMAFGNQAACQGEISATCSGSSVTCPVEQNSQGECTLMCS